MTRDERRNAVEQLVKEQGYGSPRVASLLSISETTARRDIQWLRDQGRLPRRASGDNRSKDELTTPPAPPDPHERIVPSILQPEDVGFHPEKREQQETIESLKARIALLEQQLTWATHADVGQGVDGGTMTVNLSDWHLHDRNHLPTALRSCEAKTFQVIQRFRPRRLRIVENGDIIPGRGIYKEQVLEAVLPKSHQQVSAAAVRFLEFVEGCADAAGIAPAEIPIIKTPGNHDYSENEPTSLTFVYLLRMLGLQASFAGKYHVMNLADKGVYSALFFHGYGHSKHSPSSPGLIEETLRLILKLSTDYGYHGRRKIRRVGHGHVHWASYNQERAPGVMFDVTGGFQRFVRVKQGHNERPCGWVCYASPAGSDDVIPIPVSPDQSAYEGDMTDPVLEAKNMDEAQRCLRKFTEEAQRRGIASDFWETAKQNQAEAA